MKAKSAITLAIIAALLQGCGDDDSRMKDQFVRGCAQDGVTKSICSCIYDTFTENHEPMELAKLASPGTTRSDPVVVDFMAAAQSCKNE